MEVILGVGIGLLGLLAIVCSRIITTFFHELGHAIPALLLTDGQVKMYVGSYGEEKKSLRLRMGRLTIYLSFIIWDLEIGLCTHKSGANNLYTLIVILGGPLLSLLTAAILLYLMISSDLTDGVIFILSVFMLSAVFDFLVNIIPRSKPIKLADGGLAYNDGAQIRSLLRQRKLPQDYFDIMDLIHKNEYVEAATLARNKVHQNPKESSYHEALLQALHHDEKPKEFIQAFENYLENHDPKIYFVTLWAEAKIKLHEYDEVIKMLTKIIYDGKDHYELHYLRGRALTELGEYYDAMRDFHALTLGAEEDPRALANRAYCQYRLGYEEEAREDVLQAAQNGKKNLGEIYYLAGVIFEKYDEILALEFYKKAEALKYEHHALAFNISRIEKFKNDV